MFPRWVWVKTCAGWQRLMLPKCLYCWHLLLTYLYYDHCPALLTTENTTATTCVTRDAAVPVLPATGYWRKGTGDCPLVAIGPRAGSHMVLERCWNNAGKMLERCWNDAGTMLAESMLKRCWNNAGVMLEQCWNDAGGCWNDVGTMLEKCWKDAGTMLAETMLERCWNNAGVLLE